MYIFREINVGFLFYFFLSVKLSRQLVYVLFFFLKFFVTSAKTNSKKTVLEIFNSLQKHEPVLYFVAFVRN